MKAGFIAAASVAVTFMLAPALVSALGADSSDTGPTIKEDAKSAGHAVAHGATTAGHAIADGARKFGNSVRDGFNRLKGAMTGRSPNEPAPKS